MYPFEFKFSLNIVHVFIPEFCIFSLFFFFKLWKYDNTFTEPGKYRTKLQIVQLHIAMIFWDFLVGILILNSQKLTEWISRKVEGYACVQAKLLQSYLTPCDPMDCSPPGSSVHGILQARILEWVAMPASRASSQSRDRTWVSFVSYNGCRVFVTQATWETPQ